MKSVFKILFVVTLLTLSGYQAFASDASKEECKIPHPGPAPAQIFSTYSLPTLDLVTAAKPAAKAAPQKSAWKKPLAEENKGELIAEAPPSTPAPDQATAEEPQPPQSVLFARPIGNNAYALRGAFSMTGTPWGPMYTTTVHLPSDPREWALVPLDYFNSLRTPAPTSVPLLKPTSGPLLVPTVRTTSNGIQWNKSRGVRRLSPPTTDQK